MPPVPMPTVTRVASCAASRVSTVCFILSRIAASSSRLFIFCSPFCKNGESFSLKYCSMYTNARASPGANSRVRARSAAASAKKSPSAGSPPAESTRAETANAVSGWPQTIAASVCGRSPRGAQSMWPRQNTAAAQVPHPGALRSENAPPVRSAAALHSGMPSPAPRAPRVV